ncbi:SDR family oxidoreductase [Aquisalimonas sp.]|uniref:SDR family oxidoreductase n=1 Tax=Aquisalimonas sp. TaxID=1872621 RepID=UPI0025B9B259|nr:SDR family oxidoreductase [Aquisalimonas sp.]
MDLELHQRTAVVLGASRGLGKAIAASLAAEGANVLLTARSGDALEGAAAELDALGSGRIGYHAADLAEPGTPAAIHAAAEKQLGPVDILVNNGGGPPPGPIADTERATWDEQFRSMVAPLFELAGLVLPGMRERGWGRILTVVSSGVVQPIPSLGISNALRSSIVGWSKSLANEVGGDGVTVNCLAPGRIATDRTASLDAKAAERQGISVADVERNSRALIPVGRYGDPREFGDTAAFLLSPRGSYITGSVVRVDGGLVKSV